MKTINNKRAFGIFLLLLMAIPFLFARNKAPNFLILLGDDISANSVGCYGSENPNTTPNIDKLAEEGIRFTNMFVSEAMCAPTRAELYTGLSPYRNGCIKNHGATKKGTLSIVQYLSKLGYRVGLTGKRHFSPRSVYPFEFIDGFGKNCVIHGAGQEDWNGIEEFITRDPNQPFCLIICSIHAHSPWDAGDTSPWKLDELVLPQSLVDTKETRHYFREYLAEIRKFDEQVGKAKNMLERHKLDKSTAMIVMDENGAGMPFGKWSTYDWGVRSSCIMKWPKPYDTSMVTPVIAKYSDIVPTLIDAAGGELPGNIDGKSLMPVITQKTNIHREYAFFLHNNASEGTPFASRAATDGRYKLIWTVVHEGLFAVRTINGFDYGYVDKFEDRHVRKMYLSWLAKASYDKDAMSRVQAFKYRPEFQLYDLNKDLDELDNLVDSPEYQPKFKELHKAILNWMKEQGDTELIES